MDYLARSGLRLKKKQRDRLIRLSQAHPDWALGFADEVWWSRYSFVRLHTWAQADQELKLHRQTPPKDDPDPKALACYGLLVRQAHLPHDQMLLRFVEGQPVSAITTQFLAWACGQLADQGVTALLLIWDNASWHKSQAVREWIEAHNHLVKRHVSRVRIVPFLLPVKSPWLNPIEPKWLHGKRAVVEPERTLPADELADRICDYFGCPHESHLSFP